MRYWDTLAEFERDGYDIIVDKTYEELHPRDCFDDSVTDINELCKDIDSGRLDWFMLRVRVMVEGVELGSAYLGGCLYENPQDVLTDGTAEDSIAEAMVEARSRAVAIKQRFEALAV